MKNLAMSVLVAVFGLLAFTHAASAAAAQCADPLQPNYASCGNGNPSLVTGGWGTTNSAVPAMSQGQTATDDNGVRLTCYLPQGCVDISHTDWYRAQISALIGQIGISAFQRWVSLVR